MLRNNRLIINNPGAGRERNLQRIHSILRDITSTALNGTYVPNSLSGNDRIITVHPLGGCCMAADGTAGVVNHKGQVFSGTNSKVHEGLYICDGSIVPTSLGVNPLLTISALAERISAIAAADRKWQINYAVSAPIDFERGPMIQYDLSEWFEREGENENRGIKFTEIMKGYFSTEVKIEDYQVAEGTFFLSLLFIDYLLLHWLEILTFNHIYLNTINII